MNKYNSLQPNETPSSEPAATQLGAISITGQLAPGVRELPIIPPTAGYSTAGVPTTHQILEQKLGHPLNSFPLITMNGRI